MNAQSTYPRFPSQVSRPTAPQAAAPRQPHRERDFGVGYGSSSGYASARRYVTASPQRLFRFA